MVLAEAVTVSLEDLQKGTVAMDQLQAAFGPDSLGILIVKDVPAAYAALRLRLLSYASYLGNLPEEALRGLENAPAKYLTGWSRGKETLRSGQVDTLKGSFYANCAFYVDPALACAAPTAAFSPATFPEYLSPNVWPAETADEAAAAVLPGFRATFEALCRLIIDVAVLVARACDRFAEQAIPGYAAGYLEAVVRTSTTTKARLLHYFPADKTGGDSSSNDNDDDDDDWCATHLDHGCLTGLTSAMFVDEAAARPDPTTATVVDGVLPPLPELAASPDPAAGLYIQSRAGQTVQVKIPRDCIAFQTGEALERITAGRFRAVPHFVRGPRAQTTAAATTTARIARNTLAVFTQPNLGEDVDREQHLAFGEFARGIVAKNTVG